jgi:D-alanine-D-alanine ligase
MKLNVGVFFGGKATEHEVSVISAIQAIENMDKEKYEIVPVYISKDEKFYTGAPLLDMNNYKQLDILLQQCHQVAFEKSTTSAQVILLKAPSGLWSKKLAVIDVAFPILHGYKGENGSIQGLFEVFNLPYVGSNVLASAIGMDKDIAKIVASSIDIPVIDFIAFTKYEYFAKAEDLLTKVLQKLSFPMIVKPASGGSSIGIEIAKDSLALRAAIEQVFSYDVKVIVENKVETIREVNCSVLGDLSEGKASVIEEPSTVDEILSFSDKYMQNASKGMSSARRQIPALISDVMKHEIESYSVNIFKKFGCAGVVRIDYIIDTKLNKVFFNEINTIPGSLSFYLWKHNGLEYTKQLDEMIKIAIKVHQRGNEFNYAFENNLFSSNALNLKGKLKG